MKKLLAAVQLVLRDLKNLEKPAVAAAVAAIVVPILVAVFGVKLTAAEVGGWLLIAGGVAAATLQKAYVWSGCRLPATARILITPSVGLQEPRLLSAPVGEALSMSAERTIRPLGIFLTIPLGRLRS